MGKQTSTITVRKKLGNMVGYSLKNSNNGQVDGTRIYQPIVTNPKSDGQSAQRMKLLPLQVFYDSFNDVLNHAFQGRRVGQMNRQRFMSLNMGTNSGLAPAVQKGERLLAPIRCQVSSGSVVVDTALVKVDEEGLKAANISIPEVASGGIGSGSTVAEFTESILKGNLGFEEGMEIAFIAVIASASNPRAGVPMKFFIVLDKGNTQTTVGDMMGNVQNFIEISHDEDYRLNLVSADSDYLLMGAAIIVSKKQSKNWANTNSRFVPTAIGEQYFYTQALYDAALATYGPNGSTLSSELFLQQADNALNGGGVADVISTEVKAITLTGDYVGATLSSAEAQFAVLRSGERRLVLNQAGGLVNANGGGIDVTRAGQEIPMPEILKPEMTTFAGMPTILLGSF